MSIAACPKCGFQTSPGSSECPRCGIVIAKYLERMHGPPMAPPAPPDGNPEVSLWRTGWRLFRWFCLITAIMTVYLVLNPSPAPAVIADQSHLNSAEHKILLFTRALAQGRATRLVLSESEINAWLQSRLVAMREGMAPAEEEEASKNPAPADVSPATVQEAAARAELTDLRVRLHDSRLQAHLRFRIYGKELSLEFDGVPTVQGGHLAWEDLTGRIGSLPVPRATMQLAWEKLFAQPDVADQLRVPEAISGLEVESGMLSLVAAGK
ncbi:MAG: hypothetical protein Kow00109_30200 [Acidobacteriota bacterium]